MKTPTLLFFLCSLILTKGAAQVFPHLSWQRFYDNEGDDIPEALVRTSDGHLVLGGNSLLTGDDKQPCPNAWLVKVDTAGKLIWQQEIGLSGCEELRDLAATEDGGVIFTGVTGSLINRREKGDERYWGDYFIGKLDSAGAVEWLESYGGSQLDQANAIIQGVYREYLIVGSSHSDDGDVPENHGMSDLWVLKIDTRGYPRLSQVIGGNRSDWGTGISLCQNGDYLIAGFTNSPMSRAATASIYGSGLLLRMTQAGVVTWKREITSPHGGYFEAVTELPDGRILLAGHRQTEAGDNDFWWMLLNDRGKLIREFVPAGENDEYLTSLSLCPSGQAVLLGGYARSLGSQDYFEKGGEDFWVMKVNAKGELEWRNTYGGPGDERCRDVLAYRPGLYFAVGEKYNEFTRPDGHDKDFWLLRIEEVSEDSIEAGIFVRADDYRINRQTPTRFRARYRYGDRFLWDFGDGTTSREEQPLKTYDLPGVYEVRLTVFVNDQCYQTVTLPQKLEVW